MTPRFQADADFNQRIVLGLRRREPAIDFRDAGRRCDWRRGYHRVADRGRVRGNSGPNVILVSQGLDIGAAIEDLLMIWAASDADEWRNLLGFVPL